MNISAKCDEPDSRSACVHFSLLSPISMMLEHLMNNSTVSVPFGHL